MNLEHLYQGDNRVVFQELIDQGVQVDASVAQWTLLDASLLPGAHIAAIMMAGCPYHRVIVNLEDAGFEIRDQIFWISENMNWQIGLARKSFDGTVASNVLKYGTGGLNIEAGRVGITKNVPGIERVRSGRDAIGAVIFARQGCPDWITPLFAMTEKQRTLDKQSKEGR